MNYQEKILLERSQKNYYATLCIASIDYEDLTNTALEFLHPLEYQYYKTLMHKNRQYSYLLGRYCAKKALVMEPFSINPRDSLIQAGVFGQPVLQTPHNNLQICIAHSGTLGAAIAYPEEHPMGIDIEQIDVQNTKTMVDQMTQEELNIISQCIDNHTQSTTLLWTAKEALSKILRTGFMVPFELLEISSISSEGDFFYSRFKNFHQYLACSFILNDHFITLVYPHQTKLKLNLNGIIK